MLQLSTGQHFGQNRTTLRLKDSILIEAGYTAGIEVPWHYHENAYFYYHIRGKLIEKSKKKEYHCLPGTALFHHWQEPHRNDEFSKDALFFHLELTPGWFKRHDVKADILQGDFQLGDPKYKTIFDKIYAESKVADTSTSLAIDGLSLQAFAEMIRIPIQEKAATPKWVGRVKEILHDTDGQSLTLALLSHETGLHPVYLSKAFPKYFGMPLGDYARKARIERSMTLLKTAALSVTEIAFACGFADQSHYIRSFRQYYGITPLQFRKRSATSE
jgi:AraC family transcriptional regulator